MKKPISQFISLVLLISVILYSMPMAGVLAYYMDTETSFDNLVKMGVLDMEANTSGFSPNELSPENSTSTMDIVLENKGTIDFKYSVASTSTTGTLCSSLAFKAEYNSSAYNGAISDLNINAGQFSTTSLTENWKITAELKDFSKSNQNQFCEFDIVFDAWQYNFDKGQGYTDSHTIYGKITTGKWQKVLMNELLVHPSSNRWGHDYSLGPRGEWIEVYNSDSNKEYSLDGWYLTDRERGKVFITEGNTNWATTTIGKQGSGKEWLVIYTSGQFMDNTGDIITLFDKNGTPVDSYLYGRGEYCQLEPAMGTENDEVQSAYCSSWDKVPENKSIARIADGTDNWVDPIPTPGYSNEEATTTEPIATSTEPILPVSGGSTGVGESSATTTQGAMPTSTDPIILPEAPTSTAPTSTDPLLPLPENPTSSEPIIIGMGTETPTSTEPIIAKPEEIINPNPEAIIPPDTTISPTPDLTPASMPEPMPEPAVEPTSAPLSDATLPPTP